MTQEQAVKTVHINAELHRRVGSLARLQGKTISQMVEQSLEDCLAEEFKLLEQLEDTARDKREAE